MSGNVDVLAASALAILVLMVITWVVSIALRNVSIVNIVWGVGFVMVAWVSSLTGDGDHDRSNLLTAMIAVWGMRLTVFLWRRNYGTGEDHRYRSMRKQQGDGFAARSLVTVFLFQGLLMWVVSLPVQLAMVSENESVGTLTVIGVCVWGVGFFFESVGDSQLASFKANPENEGLLLTSGLWKYTRHPNYFGDACVWWGIFIVAAETTDARYGVIGPILMTFLLLKVFGVPHLERSLSSHKPGHSDYAKRTSPFIPRPPRSIS